MATKNQIEQQLVNEIQDLSAGVSNVSVSLDEIYSRMKCDFTGWNIAESIAMLGLELKRYNDAQGYEYKK
jgi:hypothetical protein